MLNELETKTTGTIARCLNIFPSFESVTFAVRPGESKAVKKRAFDVAHQNDGP